MKLRCIIILSFFIFASLFSNINMAQQPDIIQEHWYHSYATLTIDVNAWADDYPEIVDLISAGNTELGRELWVVRLSDWSVETKPDGTKKDIVYIDGGHHGNEHLGTELAFLTTEFYIEGWATGDQEVIDVLTMTEIHILIMLNADGNDIDTRWNINQVDLNRNYDHYWNNCPPNNPTQPGSGPFSESETLANSIYMNTVVPDADLYVTMHTGVWIMLYPWGRWPDQPSDKDLFYSIREDVHANISDIPIQNANQGLYPNCGTSRDYGYGVMGYPTFTFETDDEQWLPGTTEPLSSRLGEELEVMKYLISNIWFWRARLSVTSIDVDPGNQINLKVINLGRATTANATVQYLDESGAVLWNSNNFSVNATNSSSVILDASNLTLIEDGYFELYYQKRVIDSAKWVNENISNNLININSNEEEGFLGGSLIFDPIAILVVSLFAIAWDKRRY
jgi:hypothetical protein